MSILPSVCHVFYNLVGHWHWQELHKSEVHSIITGRFGLDWIIMSLHDADNADDVERTPELREDGSESE